MAALISAMTCNPKPGSRLSYQTAASVISNSASARTVRIRILLIGSQASFEQRFLVVGKRIIIVEPTISVEFGELQTNLISVLWCEFGKFFENFSLTHMWMILSTIVSINSAARPRIGACLSLTPCFSWVALTGFRPENGFNRLPYA